MGFVVFARLHCRIHRRSCVVIHASHLWTLADSKRSAERNVISDLGQRDWACEGPSWNLVQNFGPYLFCEFNVAATARMPPELGVMWQMRTCPYFQPLAGCNNQKRQSCRLWSQPLPPKWRSLLSRWFATVWSAQRQFKPYSFNIQCAHSAAQGVQTTSGIPLTAATKLSSKGVFVSNQQLEQPDRTVEKCGNTKLLKPGTCETQIWGAPWTEEQFI